MEFFFVLLVLLVLLVATRALGDVAERLGQPALVGELIAGIVLGTVAAQQADLVPEISALGEDVVFDSIKDLGMFIIMLYAGIELQPRRLVRYSARSWPGCSSGATPSTARLTNGCAARPQP